MKDVQSQNDSRNIYLNEVGVKDLTLPVEIKMKDGSYRVTKASISLAADLNADRRGTHMSRFVDIIQENNRIDIKNIKKILETIRERLDAKTAYFDINFDYFIEKTAPVSEKKSYLDVDVTYQAEMREDGQVRFRMTVNTPVTTLCPCSKEISEYSAHNQRANVRVTADTEKFIWIEDIVRLSEESASSPIYSILKRPDEKYVTELAYDNPRFVEDVVREAELRLKKIEGLRSFEVEVESFESIHNHSAYARVIR